MFSLTPEETEALALSAKVAVWCMLLSIPPGVAVGWLLAKRQFPGKALVDALIHLPMVLPPVVPGYLLLLLLGEQGVLGHWLSRHFGLHFAFDWKGAVLASAVMAFPLMVQPVRLSMKMIDSRLEQAAATLGAPPWRVFFSVTLPLALPGVIVGSILAFSRSLGEFGATMAFVGNIPGETRTLPLAIYSYSHVPDGDGPAMRLMLLSIVVALIALLASNALARYGERRLGYRPHAEA